MRAGISSHLLNLVVARENRGCKKFNMSSQGPPRSSFKNLRALRLLLFNSSAVDFYP